MKIEILASTGIKSAFRELDIEATRIYKSTDEPHIDVWEIEKSDLSKLEEAAEWPKGWGWYKFAKGSNMGSACSFFTVNGQFMIGWDSVDGKDTYDTLTDYLKDGIKTKNNDDICNAVIGLMRVNGMNMTKLFKTFQG